MRSEAPKIPPPVRVFELATASWMSQAVSVAADLGVPDELASGPRSVDDLAEAVGAHAPTLYRLLRFLADIDVFDELDGQTFALTELGQALRSDGPTSMHGIALWAGRAIDRTTWVGFIESVRTGESTFANVHGKPVFDHLRDHPDDADVFDTAMTQVSSQIVAPIVDAYDFSSFGTIVDVGGGHGALLAKVLAANPRVRGVLFDQPGVIAGAGQPLEEAGVADRCELASGDFFELVPAGGDAYLMSNVIHDWDDERSIQLLANCRDAMADGGRVLLAEAVLPGKVEPSPAAKLMDLGMLVLTDGGRQRTETEFGNLFQRAGLKLSRTVPAGLYSVVEAVRA